MLELGFSQALEGVDVRRVVARVENSADSCFAREPLNRRALVRVDVGSDLEHLAAPARDQTLRARSRGDLVERGARLGLVLRSAEVVGERQPLVLDVESDRIAERGDLRCELGCPRIELEPVVPDVARAGNADERLGLGTRPARHEGEEAIAVCEPVELVTCVSRHGCELRARDDRSDGPVDVEDERASLRRLPERRKQFGRHRGENTVVPGLLRSKAVYIGIGVAAGFFSALFGVGGGTVIVPSLILLAGFAAAEATATSLAAIGLTALFGMVVFGILGEVNWGYAALVGLPAMAGTLVGTSLQQRVSSRLLVGLFSLLLFGIAVRLFLA
jgi:hypothetical protein